MLGGIAAVVHVHDAPIAAQPVAILPPVARRTPVVHVRNAVSCMRKGPGMIHVQELLIERILLLSTLQKGGNSYQQRGDVCLAGDGRVEKGAPLLVQYWMPRLKAVDA